MHPDTPVDRITNPALRSLYTQLFATSEQEKDELTCALSRVRIFQQLIADGQLTSLTPLLPLLLNLNGKPFTLQKHYPFEPLFHSTLTRELMLKTGRQCGKSVSLAARGLLLCNAIADLSILYITPQYEQIRRFSTQYMRPLIEHSPIRQIWTGTSTENSVLLRSFKNRSKMFFSFALLSVDRVRGVSAGMCALDEAQNLNQDFVPIIRSTMDASPYRLLLVAGTPLTLDNMIEASWQNSSQAEWCILCEHCRKINIPAMGYDLEKMIGPYHPDIGPNRAGLICAKCGLPLKPRNGRWVHRREDRVWSYPGYHIPQVIMPMHYADRERWSELLAKQRGYAGTTTAKFYNEILGESYDVGTKLVNLTDLQRACCLPWPNIPEAPLPALQRIHSYDLRVLAVDWGGGGEQKVSFTTLAVLGHSPGGKIDVIYGRRLLTPHDQVREAEDVLRVFSMFACHLLCHDYTGAGSLRETFCVQAGIPLERIVPVQYTAAARQGIMVFKPATEDHPRNRWHVDKTRSLVLVCACIKMQIIRFFQLDYVSNDEPGLLYDFLALLERKIEHLTGSDLYTIARNPAQTDDFAQAVNIGCCTIWQRTDTWPNLAEVHRFTPTPEQLDRLEPDRPWREEADPGY